MQAVINQAEYEIGMMEECAAGVKDSRGDAAEERILTVMDAVSDSFPPGPGQRSENDSDFQPPVSSVIEARTHP